MQTPMMAGMYHFNYYMGIKYEYDAIPRWYVCLLHPPHINKYMYFYACVCTVILWWLDHNYMYGRFTVFIGM